MSTNPAWNENSTLPQSKQLPLSSARNANGAALDGFRQSQPVEGYGKAFQNESSDFVALLRCCTKNKDLQRGTRIHDNILRRGLLHECSDALVTMYAKCGALSKAKALLDMHKSVDIITWNTLFAAYARSGQGQEALSCFEAMQREGIAPNAVSYACILKSCGNLRAYDKGKQIHDEIDRQGLLQNDLVLGNALVDMYVKCGDLLKAQGVLEQLPFRNVISWSTLIAGYAQWGQGEEALDCFECMLCEGIPPNAMTYSSILKACGIIKDFDKGKQIHDEIQRQGLLHEDHVLCGALVDMYAKWGALSKARRVLEELPARNVFSWSALIAGYAEKGHGEQALDCFELMQREGIPPNAITYASILKSCGAIGAIDKGIEIHDKIASLGLLRNNSVLGNALVDMYAKCGAVSKAHRVLEGLPTRNVVSWSALIAGYAQQGQGEQALDCFRRMQCEGISPNAVTFSSVLNVCSHLGLVEEGNMIFQSMRTKYGVKPDVESYTCMIDLFGRVGHLEKAVGLIEEMPYTNHPVIWHALLGACRRWGDISIGRWAFEQAIQIDISDGPAYILMGSIYVVAGMHENARDIEAMRLENTAWQ